MLVSIESFECRVFFLASDISWELALRVRYSDQD